MSAKRSIGLGMGPRVRLTATALWVWGCSAEAPEPITSEQSPGPLATAPSAAEGDANGPAPTTMGNLSPEPAGAEDPEPAALEMPSGEAPAASEPDTAGVDDSREEPAAAPTSSSSEMDLPSDAEPEPVEVPEPEPMEVPAEMPNAPYPEGPYGTSEGATIPNLNFEGWLTPDAVGYDTTQIQTVALSEFYNPDDDQGIELLLINVSAVWCGVCQAEYIDIRDSGVYESMKPRGLEILGLLFQDRRGDVPQRSDLETWSTTFDVNFPFALDPEFDTEAFFDGAGTPMNMIVDARTMELIMPMNGYSSEIFNIIDRELRSRGR